MTAAQPFIAWWPITDEDMKISDLMAAALTGDDNDLFAIAFDQGLIPVGDRRWRIAHNHLGQGPHLVCETSAIPAGALITKEPA